MAKANTATHRRERKKRVMIVWQLLAVEVGQFMLKKPDFCLFSLFLFFVRGRKSRDVTEGNSIACTSKLSGEMDWNESQSRRVACRRGEKVFWNFE